MDPSRWWLFWGIRCTEWSILNSNVNYIGREHILEAIRQATRDNLLPLLLWTAEDQTNGGRFFFFEK